MTGENLFLAGLGAAGIAMILSTCERGAASPFAHGRIGPAAPDFAAAGDAARPPDARLWRVHDAPKGWSYPFACCSGIDCRPAGRLRHPPHRRGHPLCRRQAAEGFARRRHALVQRRRGRRQPHHLPVRAAAGDVMADVTDFPGKRHADDSMLARRLAELEALINSPEIADFMKAVPLEAAHQVERWGADHDAGKSAWDWFWTCGYLAQKAAGAMLAGDLDKARHHTITTAALMLNWHRRLSEIAAIADALPCLACAKPIAEDATSYPDVNGQLCAGCAPTYADLLGDDEPFVDLESGAPLTPEQRRSLYDEHIAAGGKPGDSMALPAREAML